MTDEELVGKLMTALTPLQTEVVRLRDTVGNLQNTVSMQTSQITELNGTNQHLAAEVMQLRAIVERIPCNPIGVEHDTNPECLQSIRPKLRSIIEDEPDSVVTRQMELRASKSGIDVKGPSIMVIAFFTVAAAGITVWAWIKTLPGGSSGVP